MTPRAATGEVGDVGRITALLVAAGREEAEQVAPGLLTYLRALDRWRELGRSTIEPQTWPAHAVDPVRPSDVP